MKSFVTLAIVTVGLVAISSCRKGADREDAAAVPPAAWGSVRGHVRINGPVPENAAIRVSADPMCSQANGGQRVVGLRVGQSLQVRNSDDGLHNVHGVSPGRDGFNVGQPLSGMINTFHPRDPGILRLTCDVHTWMIAFVGVVSHPFFAVTGPDGAFVLRNVPEGTYSVRTWHEAFGTITTLVRVEGGRDAELAIEYRNATGQAEGAR